MTHLILLFGGLTSIKQNIKFNIKIHINNLGLKSRTYINYLVTFNKYVTLEKI